MDIRSDLSVLIVDDNDINLMLMVDILEAIGIENIKTFDSGVNAIEEIEKNPNYDVILMDICMPILDGYETSQQIRNLGYEGRIIALTANGISKQSSQYIECKMDDCLAKPVDIEILQRVLFPG